MISTKNFRTLASSLMLLSILFGITLAYAAAEDNYKNDNNILTNTYESTLTENGYKTNIIINPNTAGIYALENGYKLDLTINTQGIGGQLKENNYILNIIPEKTFPDTPDIAITKITKAIKIEARIIPFIYPRPPIVPFGFILQINATVSNKEFNYETFNIIIKANNTTIKTQTIALTGKSTTIITSEFDTMDMTKGNYTISVYAPPVPGETNTHDNNLTDGWILITKLGDLGGGLPPEFGKCDGKVDGIDLALWIECYKGHAPPEIMYLADLGGGLPPEFYKCDGKVDGIDLALFIACYKGLGPDP